MDIRPISRIEATLVDNIPQVKTGRKLLHVGESETAMLFEVREINERFHLYLNKKNGMKFKQSFLKSRSAKQFAAIYLQLCCAACKQRGLVYKTRGTGGMCGGGVKGKGTKGRASAGSVTICPECRARHVVTYGEREFPTWDIKAPPGTMLVGKVMILELIAE